MNPFKALALLFVFLVGLSFAFLCWRQSHLPKDSDISSSSGTYTRQQLILGPLRHYSIGTKYTDKDTLWIANVHSNDTTYIAPTDLGANGGEAEWYYGSEDSLLGYAERKGIHKFCFKDLVGNVVTYNYFIHVKADEPFHIHFELGGYTANALVEYHKAGWSRAAADAASWSGDTLYISGKVLFMSAEGITPCITCKN